MKPDRWKQISILFKVALERDPAERAAFLDEACPNDEELRTAVESLLASHEQAEEGDFIGSPAFSTPDAERETEDKPEVVPGQTTLGSYRILEKLGEGGMGAVYLAKDARLGRRVALKLLPTHFARDDERVRRFEQEARAASALNHPNILTVHEIGESEGRRFIVTEFVEGRTLRERLAEGRFALDEALDVCAQVAGALAKAHASGIVHRDIKPENVMVDEEGHVKVLDFGIAKQVAQAPSIDTEAPTTARVVNTASGVVLGTSTYMSPEQLRGQELDARTDIWSLGVLFYEMVAGRAPFEAQTYGDLIVAILHGEPPPLSEFGVEPSEEIGAVLSRALAKDKDERWPSAKELQNELRRLKRQLDFSADTVRDERDGGPGRDASVPAERVPARHKPAAAKKPPVASQRQQTTEQRRQLTVLFADFAGLLPLTEGQDAEDVSELMGELWPIVDGVVGEHGGTVDKHVGETLVALWGARGARGGDPERAVRAALAMQSAVAEFVASNLPHALGAHALAEHARAEREATARDDIATGEVAGPQRLMRVGVSTGLVLLGEVGATGEVTVTGDPVRLASRLLQAAPVGSVLVSHDTYRHVRGGFTVHPPDTPEAAGRSRPVPFFRLRHAQPRAFRVQTRRGEGA